MSTAALFHVRVLALCSLILSAAAFADTAESPQQTRAPIPEPLTLEAAMTLLDETHPDMQAAQAGILGADASRLEAEADHGFNASLLTRLRFVDPNSNASLQQHDDHALSLNMRKRLYDFGQNQARRAAAEADRQGFELMYTDARRGQLLDVISAYFAVIEADLQASWHSEAMQVEFLRNEDEVERVDLKERSELDGARSDAAYQASLALSYTSEALQRSSRSLLAQALNRPDELPSSVLRPDLPLLERPVPEDVSELVSEAISNNTALRAYGDRLQAAGRRLDAARASDGPTLDAEGSLSTSSRHLGGNDHMRIGLVLEVPLTTGGKTQARIKSSRAELLELQAQRGRYELDLRQRVLEHWQQIQLGRYQRAKAAAQLEYRGHELERSRTLYDQQVASDIGDSMAQYTRAEYEVAVADHDLALAWLHLDALLGREISLSAPVNDNSNGGVNP